MKCAGLIVIGDEILTGKVQDLNSPHVISMMRKIGVELRRMVTIPDEVEEIATQVQQFSNNYDYVITSGGIGPTHDDCTIAGIAQAFDRPVVRHPDLERRIRERMCEGVTAAALKMAEVPEGATLIGNKPYPTIVYRNVYVLPGVPEIFARELEALRPQFSGVPFFLRRLFLAEGENQIAAHLTAIVTRFQGVKIGSYPRFDESDYRVLITIESRDRAALAEAFDALVGLLPTDAVLRTEIDSESEPSD